MREIKDVLLKNLRDKHKSQGSDNPDEKAIDDLLRMDNLVLVEEISRAHNEVISRLIRRLNEKQAM